LFLDTVECRVFGFGYRYLLENSKLWTNIYLYLLIKDTELPCKVLSFGHKSTCRVLGFGLIVTITCKVLGFG
jgi:hypothetical protein